MFEPPVVLPLLEKEEDALVKKRFPLWKDVQTRISGDKLALRKVEIVFYEHAQYRGEKLENLTSENLAHLETQMQQSLVRIKEAKVHPKQFYLNYFHGLARCFCIRRFIFSDIGLQ